MCSIQVKGALNGGVSNINASLLFCDRQTPFASNSTNLKKNHVSQPSETSCETYVVIESNITTFTSTANTLIGSTTSVDLFMVVISYLKLVSIWVLCYPTLTPTKG
jgi:hypothetical protein